MSGVTENSFKSKFKFDQDQVIAKGFAKIQMGVQLTIINCIGADGTV